MSCVSSWHRNLQWQHITINSQQQKNLCLKQVNTSNLWDLGAKITSCPWGVMQVVLNTPWGGIMYERKQVRVNKNLRNHSISSLDVCHEVLTKLLWVWGSFITDILSVYQLWFPHWDPLSPWSCPLKHRQLSQLSSPLGISMKGHATRRSHDKVDIDTLRCRSGQQVHLSTGYNACALFVCLHD